MNITKGPVIEKFSALFDIPVEEVIEWVSDYVNRPETVFFDLVAYDGFIEATEEDRFRSIAEYIRARIADSADARIRESIAEEKREEG
jgi:hypothetical protein